MVGVASKGAEPPQAGTACASERLYLDRGDSEVFRELPAVLQGQAFVRAADADVGAGGARFLSLEVDAPAYVFLLWDEEGLPAQGGALPAWVASGFKDTGLVAWTSGGPMAVLKSLMPVSGPVFLGGCSAAPGKGARRNYLAVLVRASPAASGWARREEAERAGEGSTWVKELRTGRAGLAVLMYLDPATLLVHANFNPLPPGPGYMRVLRAAAGDGGAAAAWAGTAGTAEVGQLVAYGSVSEVEKGLV
eukprot:2085660-Rhodomonas_salina.1